MERASELVKTAGTLCVSGRENGSRRTPSGTEIRTEGGVLTVTVPAAVAENEPIVVGAGCCDRMEVSVGEGASVSLCLAVEEGDVRRTFAVGTNASLRIAEVVTGRAATAASETRLAEGARAELVTVELGDGEASLRYDNLLEGRGAEVMQSVIFMAADGERKEVKVRVEHRVPDCRSDVSVKGVASGTGFGSFDGMVYVAQDAQHTEAYQQSRNLVMGGRARILTSPQLEIYADDVKCSHGATVGQMNDEAIYYMRQRGLSEAEAKGLQLTGFVNEVVARMADGALAERVLEAAAEKIGRLQQDE